jgi:DNA repair exonuclease SbcCD nuclease subunit
MKILALSDLHLEFRCQGISQIVNHGPDLSAYKGKVDVVILAGDIGIGEQTWTYREDLEAYMRVPVLAIPGNHDFYGQALFPWKAVLAGRGIRNWVHVISGVRFIGATLWTDFALIGDVVAAKAYARKHMNDYNQIKGLTPDIVEAEHWQSRTWLKMELAKRFNGSTVVVTHHSPTSAARNHNYPVDLQAAGFCSDANDLIYAAADAGVAAWIYGHDHWSQTVTKTPFPMYSAQMGYPNKDTNWDGPVVIEV